VHLVYFYRISFLLFATIGGVAFAQSLPPAPVSVAAPQKPPARAAPAAVPNEDFESFPLGPLAGQGLWWSPSGSGEDYVVAPGIIGHSIRLFADAANVTNYISGRTYDAGFGVLSMDVQLPPLDTFFLFGPFSDPDPSSGLLDPHGVIAIGSSRIIFLFQRTSAQSGAYVRVNSALAENTVARLSWDIRSDGSLAVYRDGRLLTLGQSETLYYAGMPRPLGAVLFGSSNGVTRSTDGSRNAMLVDNLSGSLPIVSDPVGQIDLALVASFEHINPGQALRESAEIPVGGARDLSLFVINTSPTAASGTTIGGNLPNGYNITSADCPVIQTGTNWNTISFALAAGQTHICRARLTLPSGVPANEGWDIPIQVTSTATDPYADNNLKTMTVYSGLFANGFE
jgi:Domain of unknown function DUF11